MLADTEAEVLSYKLIKERSIKGLASLLTRSFAVQLISTLGFFLLTIYLGRSDIGIFIAVTEIIGILGYFSDIGLAASLVRKKENPTVLDLQTTFTIQQTLVLSGVAISLLATPSLVSFYHLNSSGLLLFYSLLASFVLSSLKTIPSILLERSLKFSKLATVEVVETIVFYSLAVILAIGGKGVTSYAIAVLARSLVGTILLYILHPWPIGLAFSTSSAKALLSFGLPFQANSFLAVIKDRFSNLILFKIIGPDGLSILGWAQTWSQKPLRFVMDNVSKVTFPALSRLQDEPKLLARALEKSLFFSSAIIFPILAGFAVIVRPALATIPRYSKWEIALIPLYLHLFSAAWASISTPLTNSLNAIGKVKINFYLMVVWTTLTLVLMPLLSVKYGFMGAAYATGIIALTSIIPIIITRRYIPFSLKDPVIKPLISAMLMGVSIYPLTRVFSPIWSLATGIPAGLVLYLLFLYLLIGRTFVAEVKTFIQHLKTQAQ